MAGKGGATPATYSPSPTTNRKKKPPIFKEDWVRPDGRGFHQCRPAYSFPGQLIPGGIVMPNVLGQPFGSQDGHTPQFLDGGSKSWMGPNWKRPSPPAPGVLPSPMPGRVRYSKGLRIDGALRIGDAPFSVRNIEQTFELIQLMMEVVLVQRVLGPFGTRITSGVPGIGIEIPDVVDCAVFRTGAVNAASGSAYAEFGNTKVIVSVFGPRESKKAMMYSDIGRLNCNVSFTTFATPIRGQGAIILETFPKTTVDVFALVLESSGSNSISECVAGDLPVVISCASLALADAGIMMYDIVASVSVSCFNKNLVIDPILEEEIGQDGSLMITCMPSRYEITQLTVTGEWSTTKINEGMQLCLDACAKLAKIMRSCLKEVASDSQE
ncbi:hypothetical protein JHK84_031565 [Glycine max]|nr:hypothetical protein JHK86_031428 [Glycine max]KAG5146022.1 hypothetical protein JHK84_031565 [Glycine max]